MGRPTAGMFKGMGGMAGGQGMGGQGMGGMGMGGQGMGGRGMGGGVTFGSGVAPTRSTGQDLDFRAGASR